LTFIPDLIVNSVVFFQLLRAAIEEVTNMNPDMSVEKIECMRQIEEVNER